MPGLIDHLLIALILVGIPIDGIVERRKLREALAAGVASARLDAYARVMVWQWGAAAVLTGYWIMSGRTFLLLGVRWPAGIGFLVAVAIAVVITGILAGQIRTVRSRPEAAAQVRKQAESLTFMLPSTRDELRRFSWLGVTAGIVEEFVCRGFMIWYFASFVPMWAAIVLSSVLFGIGHLYQGLAGVIKTGLVGMVLGWIYSLSGSIWVPMFIHAAVDVLQGRMIYFATASGSADDSVPSVVR